MKQNFKKTKEVGIAILIVLILFLIFYLFFSKKEMVFFIWSWFSKPRHKELYHQAENVVSWEECEKIATDSGKIPYCVGNIYDFTCATPESIFTSTFIRCFGLVARNSNNPDICFDREIIDEVLIKHPAVDPRARDSVRYTCVIGYLGNEKFDSRFKENENINEEQKRDAFNRLCQEIETTGYYKDEACSKH